MMLPRLCLCQPIFIPRTLPYLKILTILVGLGVLLIVGSFLKRGQAVRQESWQEIESESLLLGKAVTTRRVPES